MATQECTSKADLLWGDCHEPLAVLQEANFFPRNKRDTFMRIAIAGLTQGSSGITTYTKGLAKSLTEHGHQVALLCFPGSDPSGALKASQIQIRHQSRDRLRTFFSAVRTSSDESKGALGALRSWDPEIIHFTFPPLGAAITRDTPSVATAWFNPHDLFGRFKTMYRFARGGALGHLMHWWEQYRFYRADDLCFRGCRRIIALTRASWTNLRKQGFEADWIPPGITVPSPPNIELGKELDTHHIVFVANDIEDPRKGLRYLLKALALMLRGGKNGRVVLDLVGRYSPRLPSLLDYWGLDRIVRLHGFLSGEAYWRVLGRGSFLVSTSLYEEWGYVAVEAMAVGLPIAGFRQHAISDIVSSDTGLLVEPKYVQALANAMSGLLENQETLRRMSAAARELVREKYAWEFLLPRIEESYRLVREIAEKA